jgi:predicted Zn-dependent protease with MMP-like domain
LSLELSRPEFEKLVGAVLRSLPPYFRKKLAEGNVSIIVKRRPSPKKLRSIGMNPAQETLFGLYEGIPLTERTSSYNFALPDRITIYQEPLEEEFGTNLAALKKQIRSTVMHEIAHFFGISDETLKEMGWS